VEEVGAVEEDGAHLQDHHLLVIGVEGPVDLGV